MLPNRPEAGPLPDALSMADKVVPTGLVTPVNGSSLCSDLGLSGGPEVAEPVSVERRPDPRAPTLSPGGTGFAQGFELVRHGGLLRGWPRDDQQALMLHRADPRMITAGPKRA